MRRPGHTADRWAEEWDTLDKIHRPSLVPVTRAAARIVESTAGVSAAAMRGKSA